MLFRSLREAILSEDVSIFKKVKGVGAKTSQRIILELKSDMQKIVPSVSIVQKDDFAVQAIKALVYLGYQQQNASQAVEKALPKLTNKNVEELIREALKHL